MIYLHVYGKFFLSPKNVIYAFLNYIYSYPAQGSLLLAFGYHKAPVSVITIRCCSLLLELARLLGALINQGQSLPLTVDCLLK